MYKVLIFFVGIFSGFYLRMLSSADFLICGGLAVFCLPIIIVGFLFHLGVSDFQEFEQ